MSSGLLRKWYFGKEYRQTTVYLPMHVYEQVEELAERHGLPKTQVVSRLLEACLKLEVCRKLAHLG